MYRKLEGVFVTPQTPFTKDGYIINEDDLRKEIKFCINSGVQGIAALVWSAEFYALSDSERKNIAEITINEVDKRIPVVIGVSGVSTQVAVMFATHANSIGANAVIAMPPYALHDNLDGIYKYYKALSKNINIPIIIQNAPLPLGTTLPLSFLKKIITEINHEWYIKEENVPAPHFIENVVKNIGSLCSGVFGGYGGRWMITEFKRGAYGWITACEFSDILVKIYSLLKNGNEKKARKIMNLFTPLIDMEGLYGENFSKEILVRRGIMTCNHTRVPGDRELNDNDLQELDILLEKVKVFMKL